MTMTTAYTHILDLVREAEPPADGILSRTIFQDERIKAVVFSLGFGFGQDQELSDQTAAKPAMLYFVKGEASVGLGDDVQEAQAGTWVHCPPTLSTRSRRRRRRSCCWCCSSEGHPKMAKAQKPNDIDGYISQFPADVQTVRQNVRESIRQAAPEAKGIISYMMPAFRQHGILVYFAGWKGQHPNHKKGTDMQLKTVIGE
jgi:hypothetical protein